jgi:hypothetical protein
MSNSVATPDDVTFQQVLLLAQRLQPVDQARLVARLAPKVEWVLDQVASPALSQPPMPLRGLLADLGPAPSAEEIDDVQREMWATFAQE